MTKRIMMFGGAFLLLVVALLANLSAGAGAISPPDIIEALTDFDATRFEHSIILYQRIPRALIAVYAGSILAIGGVVLQGLVRNPLASPSTLGINSGAALFVVAGSLFFGLDIRGQGIAALIGAFTGFAVCLGVARLAAPYKDPKGLALILSGALVSMLFFGLTNALLLSDPGLRAEFLNWVTGNINHVYIKRLEAFWWIGVTAVVVLLAIARPLTLILLGTEKAASAGANVQLISRVALLATVCSSGSAVAICGPIGFVGLVVPHLVRPLTGSALPVSLPVAGMAGATLCLLADLGARELFRPHILHTGLILDLLGGIVFVIIVRHFYLRPSARAAI